MGLFNKIRENLGQGQPPMISIQGNRFTCRDAAGNEREPVNVLDVIIVDANQHISKEYRENRDFNPKDPAPPDCWSDNGIAPSVYAQSPQSPRCLDCRHNVRGSRISDVSGAAIKACDDRQRLAVVLADDPQRILYRFTVTITSLTNFRQYCRTVNGHNYDLDNVVTRLTFIPKEIGKVDFDAERECTEEELAWIANAQGTAAAKFVTGEDDRPRTGALPKPDAHEAIGLDAAVQILATGADVRETAEAKASRPAATREQLEETLRETRAAGKKPRLKPVQSTRDVADPAPRRVDASLAPIEEVEVPPSGVPAFLKRAGMVQNPSPPPDEVARLIQAQAAPQQSSSGPAPNPVGDRLAQAFKLPTR